MNEAKKRGVNYFWSASWSPATWMKSNNQVTYGGSLNLASYPDYADLLSRYIREYKSRFNLDISAVSIQNEPGLSTDYESCVWTPAQMSDFIKNHLGPTFAKDGIAAKIILPESNTWSLISSDANVAMNDANTRKYVSIVAGHQYDQTWGSPDPIFPPSSLETPYAPAKTYGKELWQTEVSFIGGTPDLGMHWGLGTGMLIHNAMAGAEVNAWVWWVFLNSWGDNEGLADLSGNTYKVSKRLYTLGNWSKFVRPGYVMIGITPNPVSGVYCTAFKDPATGNFAIVMINQNKSVTQVPVSFSGFSAATLIPWVTSAAKNLEKQPAITLTSSGFSVSLDAESITTYSGASNSITSSKMLLTMPSFQLSIYPNPAGQLAVVSYRLSENSNVKISVCDLLGKEVMQIANENQNAGEHQLTINAFELQSGIYFVRMNMNSEQQTQKLIINK